jgi:hypothetical protein
MFHFSLYIHVHQIDGACHVLSDIRLYLFSGRKWNVTHKLKSSKSLFFSLIKPETLQNIGTEILNPELLLNFNSLKSVQSSHVCHFIILC